MSAARAPAGDWDLTPYFPEFEGDAYRAFRVELDADVASLLSRTAAFETVESERVESFAVLLVELEKLAARAQHLASYLACLGAANADDERVQAETASAAQARAELEKIYVRVRSAVAACEDETWQRLLSDERVADVRYFLERMRQRAAFSMSAELETLATELDVTGLSAWGRLYDQVSGKLSFDLDVPGEDTRRVPVALTRSLLEDPRASVRSAALAGSNRAWEGVADVLAGSLNAIAGTRLTLYRNRGIAHFLDPALFDAGITRRTLDTMWDVVRARADVPRSYLGRKAALLGRERLGFQDLMAPLPVAAAAEIPWGEARARVRGAFARFAPELERFAAEAFDGEWIDYLPRAAKRPGGFCTGSSLIEQSRVFMTYNGAPGDVATLAHELGHAFHSRVMRGMRPWSRRYPMTLAETASTFAEQLVIDAVLSSPDASREDRAVMLDNRLQDGAGFLLNIWMRFAFETSFYEERAHGELGVARICELMTQAQRDCYGDALDPEQLDPWFWASKLHFYITGLSFYNFPYTFGYLFSLGIFARAREEGPDFVPRYAELLQQTGSDTVERVAQRALGVDLEKPEFWNASVDLIAADLEQFESLLPDVDLVAPVGS